MRKNSIRILFLFMALFLVFVLKSNVKAYEETYESISFNMPDTMIENARSLAEYSEVGSTYNLLILQDLYRDNRYLVYFLPTDVKIWHTGFWESRGFKFNPTNNWVVYEYNSSQEYVCKLDGFNWDEIPVVMNNSVYTMYTTTDIYTNSSCTTVFFQPPVPVMTILLPIVEEQKGTMATTLQEIINLLPMILVVVVSLVGFRKALVMLFSLLRQS